MPASGRFRSALLAFPGAAATAGIVVGGGAILGWALDIAALKSVLPGPVSMKPNTALGFIFSGVALRLAKPGSSRPRSRIAVACAAATLAIALLSLSEYAFGWNLGIDELLFRDPVGKLGISGPGRMAPATALCHMLLAGAIALVAIERGGRVARLLAAASGLMALVPLLAYLYGLRPVVGLASATEGVALHTAVLFVALALGVLLRGEGSPLLAILTSDGAAGVVARRIAPVAIVMPLVFGWILLLGERAALFDTSFALSLAVAAAVLLFGLLIWTNLVALDRADRARELALERLRASEQRLRLSNRELDEFATVASHDLQEPLHKVQAFAARLRARCAEDLPEEGKDYLERMEKASARMQTLVRDLLLLARVTTNAETSRPVDLGEVARGVVSDLELQIEQAGATVEVGELPHVEGDPQTMRQLLQNLVTNALKFRREGVVPRVRILSEPVSETACRVLVSDNGIGFPQEEAARIFAPFQRLHDRRDYPGTGIGLAICRRIVERHGGEITAEGVPGAGATFRVTLPLATTHGEPPAAASPPPPAREEKAPEPPAVPARDLEGVASTEPT